MASFAKNGANKSATIKTWIDEKFVPAVGKIGNQKHLNALRDGFMLLLPLIIASTIALLLKSTIFGGDNGEKSSLLGVFAIWANAPKDSVTGSAFLVNGSLTDWGKIADEAARVFNAMYNFGLNLLAIYFAFTLGFCLAKIRGNNTPEIAGLVSLGCFFIATLGGVSSAVYLNFNNTPTPLAGLAGDYRGASGIFTTIVISIISTEIFCWLSKIKRLEISMPAGVPPAVARSFAKLYPAIGACAFITFLLAIVAVPTHLTNAAMLTSQADAQGATVVGVSQAAPGSFYNLGDAIYMAIQSPFIYAASISGANFGITVLAAFLIGFLWFFGIHGVTTILGIFLPVWTILLTNNIEYLKQGPEVLANKGSIFTLESLGGFIVLGGSCATLPLVLSTLLFSKNKAEREVAKFAAPAGVFEINEPVIFGYPLVANVRYFIPMVLIMPLLCVTTWLFYQAFDTAKPTVAVPLTTPVGLQALIVTQFDWTSFVIFAINFAIAFLGWTPFVIFSSRAFVKEQEKRAQAENKQAAPV